MFWERTVIKQHGGFVTVKLHPIELLVFHMVKSSEDLLSSSMLCSGIFSIISRSN